MNHEAPVIPITRPPVDYRTQEIAIEIRNVYHTYDNKFSGLLQLARIGRANQPGHTPSSSVPNSNYNTITRNGYATPDVNNNPLYTNVPKHAYVNSIRNQQAYHIQLAELSKARHASSSSSSSVTNGNNGFKVNTPRVSVDTSINPKCPVTPALTSAFDLPPAIRNSSKLILNNLNVTIPRGCIYGLLGPSGCGKTTLLKCITGFQKPTYGKVRVFGCPPWSEMSQVPGTNLGYMPQDYSLHEDLTIAEMLTYFGRLFELPSEVIKRKIPELVDLLSLPNKNQLISSLSGGQKRRTSFICSIIHLPKLLILDEPTVGCDPLLRERIWNLLVRLAQDHRMTIIITTHYIEEARRSHLVGFMKKGYLMAENTPENLYEVYETRSLERIFYRLCVNEKMRKGSTVKRSSTVGRTIKKTHSQIQRALSQSEEERRKNFYFHNFEVNPEINASKNFQENANDHQPTSGDKLKTWFKQLYALNTKNTIQLFRKPEAAVAQFVVPLIVVMIFCVCIGSLPRDIPIGVLNDEKCNLFNTTSVLPADFASDRDLFDFSRFTTVRTSTTAAPETETEPETDSHHQLSDLCLSEDLLKSLNSYALKQIRFYDHQKALDEVRAGNLLGVLHVRSNFSEALVDKINFNNDSGFAANSIVTFEGDVTNQLLLHMFSLLFYEGYLKFIKYALVKLNMNPLLGRLPVSVGGFLFGKYIESDYSGINAYAGPGLLIIIVYSVAFALTGLALLIDKQNGMFERNRVAGVRSSAMLVSLVIVNMTLFALGLFVLLLVAIHLFDIPLNGSMTVAYVLLLLQALTGLANGLLLSSVLNSIWEYAIFGNGVLLVLFILSGALWSVESMPFYVRWISYLLPSTQAIESLRSVLVRGLYFHEAPVYMGYVISIAWSGAMLIVSKFLFDANV